MRSSAWFVASISLAIAVAVLGIVRERRAESAAEPARRVDDPRHVAHAAATTNDLEFDRRADLHLGDRPHDAIGRLSPDPRTLPDGRCRLGWS